MLTPVQQAIHDLSGYYQNATCNANEDDRTQAKNNLIKELRSTLGDLLNNTIHREKRHVSGFSEQVVILENGEDDLQTKINKVAAKVKGVWSEEFLVEEESQIDEVKILRVFFAKVVTDIETRAYFQNPRPLTEKSITRMDSLNLSETDLVTSATKELDLKEEISTSTATSTKVYHYGYLYTGYKKFKEAVLDPIAESRVGVKIGETGIAQSMKPALNSAHGWVADTRVMTYVTSPASVVEVPQSEEKDQVIEDKQK